MRARFTICSFLVAAATAAVTATATVSPPGATISLTPASLTIDAPSSGPNPAPSIATLQNSGGGKLKWNAASNSSWLSVSPTSGSLNASATIGLSVSVNVTGLAVGAYTGTIAVSDPMASNSPQNLAVTLHVNAAPTIGLSPGSLTFAVPQGGPNTPGQNVTLQNTGGGTLAWTASYSPSWLSGNAASGSLLAGASKVITLFVNVGTLSAGTYPGSMSVTASGAPNTPQSVGVTLTVSQTPAIGLAPATLLFDAPQGAANPAAETLSLSNQGGGSLNWTAATNAAWLSVGTTSGSLAAGAAQSLTISVNTAGLAEGTYLAAVTVTAAGASNTPQSATVTLNVNATPKIGINPETLSFSASTDTQSSFPSALSVTNSGSGTLAWTVSGGTSWLGVQPGAGSLAALASEPVLLSVNAAGLDPGVYTTTLKIADPNSANSPQTVAVELTVTPSVLPVHAPAGQCGILGIEVLAIMLLLRTGRRLRGGGIVW